jgi:hypothetical protein
MLYLLLPLFLHQPDLGITVDFATTADRWVSTKGSPEDSIRYPWEIACFDRPMPDFSALVWVTGTSPS